MGLEPTTLYTLYRALYQHVHVHWYLFKLDVPEQDAALAGQHCSPLLRGGAQRSSKHRANLADPERLGGAAQVVGHTRHLAWGRERGKGDSVLKQNIVT